MIIRLLETLANSDGTTITEQVKGLVTELCHIESHPVPEEVEKLEIPEYSNENEPSGSEPEDGDDEFMIDEEDVINGDEADIGNELGEAAGPATEQDPELNKLLEKVAHKQMEAHMEVSLFTLLSDDQTKTLRTCRKAHRHRS